MKMSVSIQGAVARRLGLDAPVQPAGMDYKQAMQLPLSPAPRRLPLLPRPTPKGIAGTPLA